MHENEQKTDTIFELKTGNGCQPCKKRRTQKKIDSVSNLRGDIGKWIH